MTSDAAVPSYRRSFSAILCSLTVGLLLAGCGLFSMPGNEPPSHVRIELSGATDTRARVVFSSTLYPSGDDLPIFLEADTVDANLPISRQFEIDGPEFWLIVTRDDPEHDNMGMKVWAGDFLFVDDPVLPDTQQVVTVRYRFGAFGR
jgi:hypothetical protein